MAVCFNSYIAPLLVQTAQKLKVLTFFSTFIIHENVTPSRVFTKEDMTFVSSPGNYTPIFEKSIKCLLHIEKNLQFWL
jgi:hypothetical protein